MWQIIMSVVVKKARIGDLVSIAELHGSNPHHVLDVFSDAKLLEKYTRLENYAVAEVGDAFAGYAYYHIVDGQMPQWFDAKPSGLRYAHIVKLHVRREHRGRGIATKLMEFAFRDMRERGVDAVYVETTESNLAAMHIYREKLGFQIFNKTLHMKRPLSR